MNAGGGSARNLPVPLPGMYGLVGGASSVVYLMERCTNLALQT